MTTSRVHKLINLCTVHNTPHKFFGSPSNDYHRRHVEEDLTGLQILNVVQNHLSGEILGELPLRLKVLDLSSNAFSGEISSNIANLSQLYLINLSYNIFFGEIPASLGELQNLQYLWLDHNTLEGTLPSALANCSSLVHLSVEGNALGGVVLLAISALPRLQVLSLSQNNLVGSVLASVFCNGSSHAPSLWNVRATTLTVLDVSSNALSGEVPPEMMEPDLPLMSPMREALQRRRNAAWPSDTGSGRALDDDLERFEGNGLTVHKLINLYTLEVVFLNT